MRNLGDIIEAAKDGQMPTHEECYWAMLALHSLAWFGKNDLLQIAYDERPKLFLTPQRRCDESVKRWGLAYKKDPKEWVGPSFDPSNPEYQRERAVHKKIADKFLKKENPQGGEG